MCCIYQHAASELGILDPCFFHAASLRRSRPPGWVDYLSGEIDDGTLYGVARRHVFSEKGGIERKKKFYEILFEDSEMKEGMEKAGIDMFYGKHLLRYNMRGGASGNLYLTSQEKDRFLRRIQREDKTYKLQPSSLEPA